MPPALLSSYVAELPHVQAAEALLVATATAVGAGRMRRGERRRILDGWQRMADQSRVVLKPRSAGEWAAYAAASGVAVRMERAADG